MTNPNELWIDTRLSQKEMDFLWGCISTEENKEHHKSKLIEDKDNWFFETILKNLTERLFYRDLDVYHKYYIEKEEPPPKFEMNRVWVNYQKKHEFNPLHDHSGLYSFVIFMKIPTHWKEQHALNLDNFRARVASDFMFVWTEKNIDYLRQENFSLSLEDEGRMLFFPATLRHLVYPFYECEEERVTISGNIDLEKPKIIELSGDVYEEKEKMLEMLENSVKVTKEELKQMKKKRSI